MSQRRNVLGARASSTAASSWIEMCASAGASKSRPLRTYSPRPRTCTCRRGVDARVRSCAHGHVAGDRYWVDAHLRAVTGRRTHPVHRARRYEVSEVSEQAPLARCVIPPVARSRRMSVLLAGDDSVPDYRPPFVPSYARATPKYRPASRAVHRQRRLHGWKKETPSLRAAKQRPR